MGQPSKSVKPRKYPQRTFRKPAQGGDHVKIQARIPAELHEEARFRCQLEQWSTSYLVETALKEFLDGR